MAREGYRVEALTGLHFLQRGDAQDPLIVFLHGFPDIPQSWLPVMGQVAAAGHRCVAPALPGYRPSPEPPAYDVGTLAEVIVAFATALQREPFVLVGHDWGAVITHDAVSSGHLRAAVTLSVPHPLTFLSRMATSPAQLRRSRYMGFFQLPRLPERALDDGFVAELWRRWSDGAEPPAEHVRAVEACLVDSLPGPLEYYRWMFRPLRVFLRKAATLRPTEVPVLHLHGERDRCITPDACEGQERWFAGPHETRLLPGGHFLPTEAPQRVADAVLEWVERQTPSKGS